MRGEESIEARGEELACIEHHEVPRTCRECDLVVCDRCDLSTVDLFDVLTLLGGADAGPEQQDRRLDLADVVPKVSHQQTRRASRRSATRSPDK